jgi:hypothetical protein
MSYCVKCGKQIDYDAKFCKECEPKEFNEALVANENQAQNLTVNPIVEHKENPKPNKQRAHNAGFGLALTTVVMVPFALIMYASYYSEMYDLLKYLIVGAGYFSIGDFIVSCVNVVALIVVFVVGLIMTVKANRAQGEIIKNGGVRHTATFVLSMVGRILSIFALVIAGETLFSLIKLIG